MAGNVAGMLGSVFGVAAGLTILVDLFMDIILAVGPYSLLFVLWVFYLTIQGLGFLVLYSQARTLAAVVASGLGISAGLQLVIPGLIYWPFAGLLTMVPYTIVGGLAFLRISGNGWQYPTHMQAGILFILTGPAMLFSVSPPIWFLFPLLLVVANVAAFRVFSSTRVMTTPLVTTMQPSQGADLQ